MGETVIVHSQVFTESVLIIKWYPEQRGKTTHLKKVRRLYIQAIFYSREMDDARPK